MNEGAFDIAKNDAKMIEEKMSEIGFVVQKFPEDNDRSHDTLMKYIKKGNIIDYIYLNAFFPNQEHLQPLSYAAHQKFS